MAVQRLVDDMIKHKVINEDQRELAEFILEYMEKGREAVNTQEREQWFNTIKKNRCIDEQGRLIADGDIDTFQVLLWMLCAEGIIARYEG
ncbi:MAG: hypothetical protein GSR84_03110 [Desulfurococcales archaeon]|nr:hypothetical protein [Desulfurococcales archaeon]